MGEKSTTKCPRTHLGTQNRASDFQVEYTISNRFDVCMTPWDRTKWLAKWEPLVGKPHPSLCHLDAKIVPAPPDPPSVALGSEVPCLPGQQSHCPKHRHGTGHGGRCAHILSRSRVKKVLGTRTAHSEAQDLPHYSRASSFLPELPYQPHSLEATASCFLGPGPPRPAAVHSGAWKGAVTALQMDALARVSTPTFSLATVNRIFGDASGKPFAPLIKRHRPSWLNPTALLLPSSFECRHDGR